MVENNVPSCPDQAKASATAREVICRANNEEQRTGNKKQGPARDRRAKDASKAERRAVAEALADLLCCLPPAAYFLLPAIILTETAGAASSAAAIPPPRRRHAPSATPPRRRRAAITRHRHRRTVPTSHHAGCTILPRHYLFSHTGNASASRV